MNIFLTSGIYFFNFHYFPKDLYIPTFLLRNMKRKVIKQGHNTLTVTLPKKWCDRLSVKGGDEVDLDIVNETQLNIKLPSETNQKPLESITVDFNSVSPLTTKCNMDMLYISGYDHLNILSDSPKIFEIIQKRIPQLMGFEIVEQSKNVYAVRDITKGTMDSEFDSLFRRLFLVLLSMAKQGLEFIKDKDFIGLDNLKNAEETVNKLVHCCLRILTKSGYKDRKKIMPFYVTIWYLEAIGDDLRDLFLFILKKKPNKLSIDTIKLYEEVISYFNDYYSVFYKYDKDILDSLYKRRAPFIERGYYLLPRKKEESPIIHYLLVIVMRLFDILPVLTLQNPK